MKKIALLLVLSISIIACNTAIEEVIEVIPDQGSYKVYVDDEVISEHSPEGSSIINGMIATGNQVDFLITVFNAPEIGETLDIDLEAFVEDITASPMVEISGTIIPYQGKFFSGTITRVSKFKVEFDGIIKEELTQGTSHTCHGFVEVEAVIDL